MTKTSLLPSESDCCCLEGNHLVQSAAESYVPVCTASGSWTLGGTCQQNSDVRSLVDSTKGITYQDQENSLTSLDVRGNVEILWFDGLVYLSLYKGQKKVSSIKVEFEDRTEILVKGNELYIQDKAEPKVSQPTIMNLGSKVESSMKVDGHRTSLDSAELIASRMDSIDNHLSLTTSFTSMPSVPPEPSSRTNKAQNVANGKPIQAIPSQQQQQGGEERKLFRCDLCPFSVTQEILLEHHKNKEHTFRDQHTCTICERAFVSLREFHRHMKAHDPDKAYKCQYCPKAFNRYAYLKCHVRIHTGEKPFRCSECSMCFTQKTHLIDHRRRAHTKERPFQCDVCGNCFFAATDLKQHIVVHTGLKRHKCNICNKSFSQACNLKRHKLTHTAWKLSSEMV